MVFTILIRVLFTAARRIITLFAETNLHFLEINKNMNTSKQKTLAEFSKLFQNITMF